MKLTKVCLKVRASVVIDEFLTKMYFIFNSFLAQQARQRSGLDIQIHKSRGYPVIILEVLLLTTYRSGLGKIRSGIPEVHIF